MFQLLIDKKFLDKIAKSGNEDENKLIVFWRKIQPDIEIWFNFESDEDMLNNTGYKNIFISDQPIRTNNKSDLFEDIISFDKFQPSVLVFAELPIGIAEQLKRQKGVETISTTNLKEKWKLYLYMLNSRKEKSLSLENTNNYSFKSFKSEPFLSVLNNRSIVIIDKYILKNKRSVELNLIPLIKALIPNENSYVIDVLILCEDIFLLSPDNSTSEQMREKARKVVRLLEQEISTSLNISIVNLSKSFYNGITRHDRTVYTNYYRIKATGGFDIYNENGQRKIDDSEIYIDFSFRPFILKTIDAQLLDLKVYLDRVTKVDTSIFKFYPEEISNKLLQKNTWSYVR